MASRWGVGLERILRSLLITTKCARQQRQDDEHVHEYKTHREANEPQKGGALSSYYSECAKR